ncbi:MAG TPA: glycosyltransferase [Acetobacteraceae bacterium]
MTHLNIDPAIRLPSILAADLADPLFWRPLRVGPASAWYGHLPFAFWLTAEHRPTLLVELGTHTGVSYSAFCAAVVMRRLQTRCFAVDTWEGDQHTGAYGDDVFAEFRQFHDQHFRAFSTLLRMSFDAAREVIPDGTVDLLHVDGEHTYESVRRDFESWAPKLSDRSIVLFHDTNVRERNFGVWRLWRELREQHPGFEFYHSSGLGVLVTGSDVAPGVTALLQADDESAARIRDRFAVLGDGWEAEAHARQRADRIADQATQASAERDEFHQQWALAARERADLGSRLEDLANQLGRARAELDSSAWREKEQQAAEAQVRSAYNAALRDLAQVRSTVAALQEERALVLGSTSWRLTAPLRWFGQGVPYPLRRVGRKLLGGAVESRRRVRPRGADTAAKATEPRSSAASGARHVTVVSGEAHTPGHRYRVLRLVEAIAATGADAGWLRVEDLADRIDEVAAADVIIIWRAGHSPEIERLMAAARENGAKIVFDIDDLMFRPEFATPEYIDGIRSQRFLVEDVADHFERIRGALLKADACICTTDEMAGHIRSLQKAAYVLPNGFDDATHQSSRLAVRRRRMSPGNGLVRLGYASGTRTHQRDFAQAAAAIARVLQERPFCRLVLFRASDSKEPVLHISEFPMFDSLMAQIEWRDMVGLDDLPTELARFDINLAPLELDNPFCEAKSELKYFEAALVEVCTVASPTGPMRRVIRDNETGLLARTEEDWYRALLRLVDDATERARLAHAAYQDVLWPFSPVRRKELARNFLVQLEGGPEAARAFELELHRRSSDATGKIPLPATEVTFAADRLGEAEATVVVPLYNYAHYVEEALASVRAQTIPLLDLVLVDDASTDESLAVATRWARANADRFNRVLVLRNSTNAGLALTRNAGFNASETKYILPLDADNRLLPRCLEACLSAAHKSSAAFIYPEIKCFGDTDGVIGAESFSPMRLAGGNYIDAMALVTKYTWAAVGGYTHITHGWEDYDFWCRCVERGFWGEQVAEVLAEYRVHGQSMLRTSTDILAHKQFVIRQLEQRHPWLTILRAG